MLQVAEFAHGKVQARQEIVCLPVHNRLFQQPIVLQNSYHLLCPILLPRFILGMLYLKKQKTQAVKSDIFEILRVFNTFLPNLRVRECSKISNKNQSHNEKNETQHGKRIQSAHGSLKSKGYLEERKLLDSIDRSIVKEPSA